MPVCAAIQCCCGTERGEGQDRSQSSSQCWVMQGWGVGYLSVDGSDSFLTWNNTTVFMDLDNCTCKRMTDCYPVNGLTMRLVFSPVYVSYILIMDQKQALKWLHRGQQHRRPGICFLFVYHYYSAVQSMPSRAVKMGFPALSVSLKSDHPWHPSSLTPFSVTSVPFCDIQPLERLTK